MNIKGFSIVDETNNPVLHVPSDGDNNTREVPYFSASENDLEEIVKTVGNNWRVIPAILQLQL